MNRIVCKFADLPVAIEYEVSGLKSFVHGYETDESPLFSLKVDKAEIEKERARNKGAEGYADGYIQSLALLRTFAEKAVSYGVVLFHGSAVGEGENAYLFTAPSGTGKSTHTALWKKLFPSVYYLNDDKPLLRLAGGEVKVYGTPWDGKHRLSENRSAVLKGLCFLSRGKENEIVRVDGKKMLVSALKSAYIPDDEETAEKVIELVKNILLRVGTYALKCNTEQSGAALSHGVMTKEEV